MNNCFLQPKHGGPGATSNKGIPTSHKGKTTSSKKLLVARCIATSGQKLPVAKSY